VGISFEKIKQLPTPTVCFRFL